MNFITCRTCTVTLTSVLLLGPSDPVRALETEVLTEEIVTRYTAAQNGAGPLWCYGSPLVVRIGDTVYVSVIETGENIPPLCNTRWQLWRRSQGTWEVVNQARDYREREPCPLVRLKGGHLFLSTNPSTQPPETQYGPCKPTILAFSATDVRAPPTREMPSWSDAANFTDHSYRGLAADGQGGELLLLNIDARSSAQYVSWRDKQGEWHARDKIAFPIRAAYPQVALRRGAAHVLAIGDIREPNEVWRNLKYEKLKRDWDYVFRRLFYTFTPDIANEEFRPPLEVDSVEQTGGHITNLDLHIGADGAAHLLYLKRPHLYRFLRDAFFPNEPMTATLEYALLREGRVIEKRALDVTTTGGEVIREPSYARFHVGLRERLFVVGAGTMEAAGKAGRFINFIRGIEAEDHATEITLTRPFRTFFTSSPRGGCDPSDTIDLFGLSDDAPNLRYARIRH